MNLKNKRMRVSVIAMLAFFVLAFIGIGFYKNISRAYWFQDDNGKKYALPDGKIAVGFTNIDEQYYYFDADGYLITGKFYVEEEDTYYYANEDGIILNGVISHDGKFYIADEEGKLQKGFTEYESNYYYFDETAELVKGWFKYDNNWYYAGEAGILQTGFLTLDGYRYYLNTDGTRVSDTIMEIDGTTYIFNSDGSIDENATTLYPVYRYLEDKRTEYEASEITINSKVQACAILRASNLKNGYRIEERESVSDLLQNRGVSSAGGFEFSYGGIEDYGIERLLSDMQKDYHLETVLKDNSVTEVGIGVHTQDNISYYDIIFICKE